MRVAQTAVEGRRTGGQHAGAHGRDQLHVPLALESRHERLDAGVLLPPAHRRFGHGDEEAGRAALAARARSDAARAGIGRGIINRRRVGCAGSGMPPQKAAGPAARTPQGP